MSPQKYFRIFTVTSEGKTKYDLCQSDNGSSFESVHVFRFLHHAKARLLKMAAAFESYHYLIQDGDTILEQVHHPEIDLDSSESKAPTLYKKVVYRLIKYAADCYVVDCQTWVSLNKDIQNAQYDIATVGTFPSFTQAQNALRQHASSLPAYTFISAGYKPNAKNLTVYQNEPFFRFNHNPNDVWFETVAPSATAGDEGATVSPPSNTGGLDTEEQKGLQVTSEESANQVLPEFLKGDEAFEQKIKISEAYAHQYFENGVLKTLMLRRGINSPAFIDTLSFVVFEAAFHYLDDNAQWVKGDSIVLKVIREISEVMGLQLIKETQGRNGYVYGLQFGDLEQQRNFGFVCWGGEQQNGSIMFHFTGEGLAYAKEHWEHELFAFLSKYPDTARITRIDITHDFLFGDYTLDQAVSDWQNDKYTVRQTKPQAECQGTDWLSDTNKGRTFYIGSKKSSRILYFYEKGKQLGDENSPWVRLELRQRNKDYIIPFDVLIHCGDYLCSAYPYLAQVLSYDFCEQYKFERIKKLNGIAVDHVVKYAKMQVSPAIKMLQSLGLDSEDIVTRLLNPKAKLPKRLNLTRANTPITEYSKEFKE